MLLFVFSGLEVNHDKWRGETLLRSSYSSKLLNRGPLTNSTSPPGGDREPNHYALLVC